LRRIEDARAGRRRSKTDAELEAEHLAAMVDRFIIGPDGKARPVPLREGE